MTSGVYQLTFSSGDTYIGKSINIEERWKQHTNKMYKGTAAKNMQAAFNAYGAPMGRILRECHEDHIDVVESCFISRNKPTLNSDRPKDPYPDLTPEQLDFLFDTYVHSARDLVAINQQDEAAAEREKEALNSTLRGIQKEMEGTIKDIAELEVLNARLIRKRGDEELQADISNKIKEQGKYINSLVKDYSNLTRINQDLTVLVEQQKREITYHRLPWWKKMFS
ncbi:MAG: GIY-YIG nuclease family protein [Methylococcales bacterium]